MNAISPEYLDALLTSNLIQASMMTLARSDQILGAGDQRTRSCFDQIWSKVTFCGLNIVNKISIELQI